MQARNPQQHAGHQFPQDGGQLQAHHQFGQRPSRQEDHQEATHLDQGFDHLHLVTADVQQQRRQGHRYLGGGQWRRP